VPLSTTDFLDRKIRKELLTVVCSPLTYAQSQQVRSRIRGAGSERLLAGHNVIKKAEDCDSNLPYL
jgi:hypothetical protein